MHLQTITLFELIYRRELCGTFVRKESPLWGIRKDIEIMLPLSQYGVPYLSEIVTVMEAIITERSQ
jgi:hypothetical protein